MSGAGTLTGRRVLVVEDDYFVAEELRRALQAKGAVVIGPVSRVDDALALIVDGHDLDAAVLDIHLSEAKSYPIADVLQALKVPFIWATGYDEDTIPPRFAGVRRCDKPVDLALVVAVLQAG